MSAQAKLDLSSLIQPSEVFSSPSDEDKKQVSTVHRALAFERARGKTVPELAEDFGMTIQAVEKLTQARWFTDLVFQLQTGDGMTYEERLDSLVDIALEKQARILMTSQDEKLLVTLSNQILDRGRGKAIQNIQMKSVSINVDRKISELDKDIADTERRIAELTKYATAELETEEVPA